MKKFTLLIIVIMIATNVLNAQQRYLADNVNQKFAALGVIGADMHFISDSPITTGENAGAIDPANPSVGYVLDDAGDFYQIEVQTGTYTLLGNMLSDWRGMEFDGATGILYAITGTDLYIIDPVAVTAGLVGSLGFNDGEYPIALGIYNGTGYIIESHIGNSYTLNLETGEAELLAALHPYVDITDIGGMSGLTVIFTANDLYRYGFLATLNPITSEFEVIEFIDSVGAYNQEHGWFSYGDIFWDLSPCPQPIFIDAQVNSGSEIMYSWMNWSEDDAVNGYDWEIYYKDEDPDTSTPVQSGHTPQYENYVIVSDLESGFFYDFYVIRDCATNGTSIRSTRKRAQTFLYNAKCDIMNFYDGGGGNEGYFNKMVFGHIRHVNPENEGEGVEVSFLEFDLQDGHDALYVYDGPDPDSPLIDSGQPETETGFPAGGYTGSTLMGTTFISTDESGKLTFVLYSDGDITNNTGWNASVSCFQRPPNDKIVNAYNINELNGFPYVDDNQLLRYAIKEAGNPNGCDISGKRGVWYKFTAEENATVTAEVVSPGGDTYVSFYSGPDMDATETDLTFVDQVTNHCDQTSVSSVIVEEGQVYYVYVVNSEGESDVNISSTPLMGVSDNAIEGFTYHPNPTTGKLSFKGKDKIDTVVIFNLSGQKIWQETVNAASGQIDLSKFPAGVYLMQVETNGQRGAYKIIKK